MTEAKALTEAERIATVLAEHQTEQLWKAGGWAGDTACSCGWRMAMWSRKDFPEVHRRHVAEQLAARVTAAEDRMREAAAAVEAVISEAELGDVRTLDDFREECVTIDDLRTALVAPTAHDAATMPEVGR
jgi:hypothetical protein